jgi:hypothetical protein
MFSLKKVHIFQKKCPKPKMSKIQSCISPPGIFFCFFRRWPTLKASIYEAPGIPSSNLSNKQIPVSIVSKTYFHKHVVTRTLRHKYTITIYFQHTLDVTIYPRTFTSPYEIVKSRYTTFMTHILKKIYITPILADVYSMKNRKLQDVWTNVIVNVHWVNDIMWHLLWSICLARFS